MFFSDASGCRHALRSKRLVLAAILLTASVHAHHPFAVFFRCEAFRNCSRNGCRIFSGFWMPVREVTRDPSFAGNYAAP